MRLIEMGKVAKGRFLTGNENYVNPKRRKYEKKILMIIFLPLGEIDSHQPPKNEQEKKFLWLLSTRHLLRRTRQ